MQYLGLARKSSNLKKGKAKKRDSDSIRADRNQGSHIFDDEDEEDEEIGNNNFDDDEMN